jgi:hypothetical protein
VAYSITNTDGTVTINVADQAIDSTFSLNLIGPNATNYGDDIARNTVRQLENFAGTTAPNPTTKLIGQLWYDKNDNVLRAWSGTVWQELRPQVLNTEPTGTGIEASSSGDVYFNSVNNQSYIHDGTSWKLQSYAGEVSGAYKSVDAIGEPQTAYGSKFKTIYLKDAGNVSRAVAALVSVNDSTNSLYKGVTNGETVMAVFTDDAFTLGNFNSEAEGIEVNYYPEFAGTGGVGLNLVKGMNLRADYSQTSVPLADLATRATTANALYSSTTGTNIESDFSGGIGSTYIFNSKLDIIPADDNSRKLGDATKIFAQTYTNELHLGKDSTSAGKILFENADIQIGADVDDASPAVNGYPASHIYTKDLTVSGNVSFDTGVQNLGSQSTPLENLYANTTIVLGGASGDITLNNFGFPPASTPSDNQALTYDSATGNIDFTSVALSTTQMIAGAGLTGGGDLSANRTFNVVGTDDIIVTADLVGVRASDTNQVNYIVKRNSAGNFSGGTITADTSLVTPLVTVTTVNATNVTATQTVQAEHLSSTDDATITDTLTAGTLTDGTATLTSGALTGVTNLGATTATFSGNINGTYFNGTATQAQYADLAEIYKADDEYEAGTVVKLGGEFEITQTTSPEDVGIFGVISTDPAYLMNSNAEGLPVALTGRCPVKVVGPVEKGDRITSSEIAGYGKKYNEENYDPRVVIGRSLTDKETDDEGIIEVIIGIK